tara:strand:+ start:2088 stop:2495 length:408 start_codon:yes stop_codon:yes gene_type:complete
MPNLTKTIQALADSVRDPWGRIRTVESICYGFAEKLQYFKDQRDAIESDMLKEEERCIEAGCEASMKHENLFTRWEVKKDSVADLEALLTSAKEVYKKESGEEYIHGKKKSRTPSKNSAYNEYLSRWNRQPLSTE